MSDSTRYFQLTSDILVEYHYSSLSTINDMRKDNSDIIDLLNDAAMVNDYYNSTRTFLWKQLDDRFVLPVNRGESKFVLCKSSNQTNHIWDIDPNNFFYDPSKFSYGDSFNVTNSDTQNGFKDCDVLRDTFRLHFTSRNYFRDYDGLIITVHIYDKIKNRIGLLSQYIQRTDDPELNPNPVLINQKLYTTYKDFSIPNTLAILKANNETINEKLPAELKLKEALSSTYGIMENTPVIMNIYGVKSTYEDKTYKYFNTEKINSIYIPIEEKSNQFEIRIEEATDGDYFKIYPSVDNGSISFSDYISDVSDGHPENYVVFYELTLTEWYKDASNTDHHAITHREQYIINGAEHADEGTEKYKSNEGELDDKMYYRPIVINSGRIIKFTINVNLNIINTLDNTTIVKRTSLDYSPQNGYNPKKYGKQMSKIYLGEIPSQVNVYNKKPDIDRDGVKIINSGGGSGVKIENHQHSVIGFIECANVGVSIEQVPTESLQ